MPSAMYRTIDLVNMTKSWCSENPAWHGFSEKQTLRELFALCWLVRSGLQHLCLHEAPLTLFDRTASYSASVLCSTMSCLSVNAAGH